MSLVLFAKFEIPVDLWAVNNTTATTKTPVENNNSFVHEDGARVETQRGVNMGTVKRFTQQVIILFKIYFISKSQMWTLNT